MIAEPNSTTTTTPDASSTTAVLDPASGVLSADELYQLTLYKWRYSLEAYGFAQAEVRELMFVKWLHASRRVLP